MSVDLSDDMKDTLMNVLQHAAAEDRAVIEFRNDDGNLIAMDITDHVEALEDE